jgi:DNA-binding transcriptional MocR family regulator
MPTLPTIQLTQRPGIIDLGWGHPDSTLLPAAELRQAASAAIERWGAEALAYGADRGAGPLIEWLCERMAQTDARAPSYDEIVITGGVSHGLDQVCALNTRPGDVVLVESPTYHLAVRILRDHPLELLPVPADEHGLNVDALTGALTALRRAGRRARMLYTIPTYHNPTGSSMRADRRQALVDLAVAEKFLIVEDDVYRELAYDGPAPPSLWSIAPPGVVARLGSFAKSLAPGLRVGWLTADAAMTQRTIGSGVIDSGGGINHFTAMVVAQFCASGDFDRQVARFRTAYRDRRDALLAALAAHLPPDCAVTPPGGGFFVWLRLPAGLDADALLPHAEAAGVSYLPGAGFHLDGRGANTVRLAFSLYEPAELVEGARRLGAALRANPTS